MAMTVEDLHDLIRVLEEHPEWRSEVKRVLLGNELLRVPEVVRETVTLLQQHARILLQRSQALVELTEAQRRTEQRVEELAEAQNQLVTAVRRLESSVERLVDWQRGEADRREGEQYEQ